MSLLARGTGWRRTGRRSPVSGSAEPRWCTIGPVVVVFALIFGALPTSAARAADPHEATSSRRARKEAIAAIPFAELSLAEQEAVRGVIDDTAIYRRMPTTVVDCDPQMYQFLVRHPEVIVKIWDVLGVSNVTMDRTGENTYRVSDGQGTLGNVTMLHDGHDRQLIYAEGSYDGPLFRWPVRGKTVMLLRWGHLRETNGRYYVTARLDTFIQIERVGLELLAKTFQPLVSRAADLNFTETMGFVASLSRTAELKPRGIEYLASELTNIGPEVRRRFVTVSKSVAERAGREQVSRERSARSAGSSRSRLAQREAAGETRSER